MTISYAPYIVGLDLGQVSDPSALAIAQRTEQSWGHTTQVHYAIRHLQRFPLGTPYGGTCIHSRRAKDPCSDCPGAYSIGGIVEQVAVLLDRLPIPNGWYEQLAQPSGRLHTFRNEPPWVLVLDCTGVGRGVADMFRTLEYWPILVTMTSGNAMVALENDEWHVAKRQLVSQFQVAIQTRRVHIAPIVVNHVRMDRELVKEAMNFQYKISEKTGDDSYGAWRAGQHDDLLFACMLAVWHGELTAPPAMVEHSQQFATGMESPWEILGGQYAGRKF